MAVISNLNDVFFNYYFLIGGLFLSYLVYRLFHALLSDNSYIYTKYTARGHSWRSIDCNKSVPYSVYCTVCKKLMVSLAGLFCECCAVSACKRCHRIVEKKYRCKQISWPYDKPFYHHWVNVGNYRGENSDHSEEGLKSFYCCWCHRVKFCHDSAFNDSEPCDFQKYRNLIIPPNCVQMQHGLVTSIKSIPDNDDWEPLIVFANQKSGSNQGDEVLSLFRGLLNPIQVIDISVTPPETVVRWLPARCRVLAAGGDGTVAWILNALRTAPHIRAPVGVLPMGTGNDLARVLGWGGGCGSHLDAHALIHSLVHAQEQLLDRWKVRIKPRRGRLSRARGEREVFAYNYCTVGVDAQVALDFHRARTQFLYRYASRWTNYLAYLFLGAGRVWDSGACEGLEKRIRVRLNDREPLPLPPLQALGALNIPSWGAGVDLWSMGSEDDVGKQSMNDGKFEVFGISSSFQIARLQCGLAEPYRFAQASKIKIELTGKCAMQVDGEPWMQSAAVIAIEPAGQCLVLRAVETHSD